MSHQRRFRHTILNVIIAAAVLMSACNWFTPSPTPTPAPSPTAPAPTATPFPPIAPVVIDYLPQPGEELPSNGTVSVFFDQPMDTRSAEAAFAIEPSVAGTFEWADNNATLHFKPKGLERQSKYAVTVSDAARNRANLNLTVPFRFTFTTVGYLEVSQVLPAPDTQDAETSALITVMFNRPVVPLTTAGDQTNLPNPLTIEPAVKGKGEWLNTSIYVFRADPAFDAGATYTVKVQAGLTDTTGGTLKEDYVWSFRTVPPAVLFSNFYEGQTAVPLEPVIDVTFNQRMDHAGTEAAFSLTDPAGNRVPGKIGWEYHPPDPFATPGEGGNGGHDSAPASGGGEMPDYSETLTFTPTVRLQLNTVYTVRVGLGARALGGAALENEFSVNFTTVGYPGIRYTSPIDGETGVDPYSGFSIEFLSPMDMSSIEGRLTIDPQPTNVITNGWETSFYMSWDQQPSTDYVVTISPGMRDPYGNTINEERVIRFTTRAYDPVAYLNVPGAVGTYNGYDDTRVFARFRNTSELRLALYRLPASAFANLATTSYYDLRYYQPAGNTLVRSWTESVSAKLNQTGFKELLLAGPDGGALEPGAYFLTLDAPGVQQDDWYGRISRHLLVVSKTNVTVKSAWREGLVWVTDLQSGRPVSGQPLKLYRYDDSRGENVLVAEGVTGADGVWRGDYEAIRDLWNGVTAVLEGGPAGFGASTSAWSDGISPWDFNLSSEYYRTDYRGYVYTDRPIYRPGQVVYFKAVLRTDDDAHYALLKGREVRAHIMDDQFREVYSTTLSMTAYGTAFGEFTLASEASLGYYQVIVDNPDVRPDESDSTFSVGFQVAEYRKPEYLVTVTADKPEVVQGEPIKVTVQATYFFGGPVADADVYYAVNANDYYFYWPGPGWYDFGEFDPSAGYESYYYGRFIADGNGHTDAQGRFTVELPASLGDRLNSQTFTIEATVTDITNQSVSERTSVVVHRGDFYVGLAPADYVGTVNQPQTVNLLTVDWKRQPAGAQPLQVVFMQHDWNCALQEDEDGAMQWRCDALDTPVFTTTVTTDEQGQGIATFTPEQGGVYRVQAKGTDRGGRTVSASTYLWVSSGDYVPWRQNNNDRIDLVAGQKSYQPGDTAEILIPSPFQGEATALVAVERGRILRYEVLTLNSNSTVYRLPILPDYTPNVFVSVVIVKPGGGEQPADYRVGLIGLNVSTAQKEITLTLTPDKTQLGPRDTVTYDVRATDFAGNPVQAEVSVGLIDLSVLSLTGPNSGPILDAFYSTRGLGVRTGVGLLLSVDRLNVVAQKTVESKGGGGGDGEGGGMSVRQQFPDTAFWKADLVTDASGRASFSVTLPDSLTTWRLDARAISVDTLAGQATTDVIATKPLLIRPVTPRFFVVGDKATIAAVVNNNTGGAISADVQLISSGVDVLDPTAQTIELPAGGKVRVVWHVTVQDVSNVDLTFRVVGGGYEDATKPTLGIPPNQLLPVYQYSTPETTGTAGVLTGADSRTEIIALPPRLDITQGEVTINVAPSLAATTIDGLTYLEKYPYECLEQAVSRFVPNVATYRALKKLNVKDPELEARLPGLISEGLQRIYAEQHSDGGWGWFVNYKSSPYMTAYVLFGLATAEDAGFTVDGNVRSRGADYLKGYLRAPQNVTTMSQSNQQAWMLYVLAVSGEGDTARTSAWYDARQKLSHYARAYLALTLAELDPNDQTRPRTIISDLANAAVLSATGAHWEESEYDWWAMNTDTRSTAIVLDALARLDPENQLNPNVVRWLMVARQGDAWSTTQETAWSLIAFTDYMASTGELDANYKWGVAINYQPLATGQANADTLRQTTRLTVDVAGLLRDASNRLTIERDAGTGRLYYTAHLRAFLPVEDVKALSRGVTVQRQYFLAPLPSEVERCNASGGTDPTCKPRPISEAQVGDTIQVKLTLIVPHDLYYFYLEDPLPAGTEAIDTSLKTSRQDVEPPRVTPQSWDFYWGWWYFGQTQLRDEKTVLFAESLPAGTYVYSYNIQATIAGEFKVMPAHAAEFYFPEVWGRSDGQIFRITEK